jgi:hypothetical protein
MFARYIAVLLIVPALFALAEPIPAPAPVPTFPPEAKRDIFDSIAAGATSAFGQFTSGAGDIATFATSEYSFRTFPVVLMDG